MSISLVLRLLLGCALVWPAADAVSFLYQRVVGNAVTPWSDRLTLDVDEKMRRATRENADLLAEVRAACPPDSVAVAELISGNPEDYEPAELMRLARQVGLIDQLRVLLFPNPIIVRRPGAKSYVEQRAASGKPTLYLWLPGNERPKPSAGWERLHQAMMFELWLCRKV